MNVAAAAAGDQKNKSVARGKLVSIQSNWAQEESSTVVCLCVSLETAAAAASRGDRRSSSGGRRRRGCWCALHHRIRLVDVL